MVLCIIYGHDEGQAVVVVGDVYLLQPVAVMLGKASFLFAYAIGLFVSFSSFR